MERQIIITATVKELEDEFQASLLGLFKEKIIKQFGEDYTFSFDGTTFRAEKITDLLPSQNDFFSKKVIIYLNEAYNFKKISCRTKNYLYPITKDDETIFELLQHTALELLKFRNFGAKSYEELIRCLYNDGIKNIFELPIGQNPGQMAGMDSERFEIFKREILNS